ncbi:MAG: type II secretion system protein, partial [Candidatus Polarisedimenticolia bacterium]
MGCAKEVVDRRRERGSFLILVMVFVAITTIGLGIAAQAYSVKLRRDKEEELIFRAKQYVQAILAYRKENGGRFPLNLEDLYKPGPRGLRYVRKLYKEPIARNGRWGLLYLMPGGQGVYDPVAAHQAKEQAKDAWGSDAPIGAGPAGAPGVIPINMGQAAAGKQAGAAGQQGALQGAVPGAMPVGALPGGLPPPAPEDDAGIDDEERV